MLAKVVFFGPDRGGRRSAPLPGYRPQLDLGDVQTSCVIGEEETAGQYDFDIEHLVPLRLMFAEAYGDRVRPGTTYPLREGPRQIGVATIVRGPATKPQAFLVKGRA